MKRLLIAAAFVLTSSAWAQQTDAPLDYAKSGNEFLAVCDQPGPANLEKFECASYVEGVMDGTELAFQMQFLDTHPAASQAASPYCLPLNVTLGQSVAVVIQFIKSHPAEAHRKTSLLIFMAITEAFPCRTKGK